MSNTELGMKMLQDVAASTAYNMRRACSDNTLFIQPIAQAFHDLLNSWQVIESRPISKEYMQSQFDRQDNAVDHLKIVGHFVSSVRMSNGQVLKM